MEIIKINEFCPSKEPLIPRNKVHNPSPFIIVSDNFCGIPFLKNIPMDAPMITAIVFTIVPNIFTTYVFFQIRKSRFRLFL